MLPFLAAAAGAWTLPPPWPGIAIALAILWGGLILAFVAGVRRGFGFGVPSVPKGAAIGTMLGYFVPAGLALVLGRFGWPQAALALLLASYALAGWNDRRAALLGHAPRHFARLRPPQMACAVLGLAALLAWTIVRG
jgi:hypothetical protein